MRSQIVLQVLNDAVVGEEKDRELLAAHAVHSVERLIAAFDSEGQIWLKQNLSGKALDGAELMSFIRHLVAARDVINEIARTAKEQGLPASEWRPAWLNEFVEPIARECATSGGERVTNG